MTGTSSQIEWAERIKQSVDAEFDRVTRAFEEVAGRQPEPDRSETLTVIAILEEKRGEVMAHEEVGYFIKEWQELCDQIRKLIWSDPRYQSVRTIRDARRSALRAAALQR